MADERAPVDRLLDLVLFAPIGAVVALRDDLAKFAALGRREVDLARFVGRFAAQQGQRELTKRFRTRCPSTAAEPAPVRQPTTAAAPAKPATAPVEAKSAAKRSSAKPVTKGPGVAAPADPGHPDADSLPIADYDSLAASQVVARLSALSDHEMDAIEVYELRHRARRTVLGKITQLRSSK